MYRLSSRNTVHFYEGAKRPKFLLAVVLYCFIILLCYSYLVYLGDFQTALKPLEKSEKLK